MRLSLQLLNSSHLLHSISADSETKTTMSSEAVLHIQPTAQALKLLIAIFKAPAIKIQESSEPVTSYS